MSYITTTLVETNYVASEQNHYIGVNSKKPVTILLPENPKDGKVLIVKAQMRPPIGDRKITITTSDGSTIDGYSNYVIQVSNEFVHLIYHGDAWHVI